MHSFALSFLEIDPPLFILFCLLMAHWCCWNIGIKIENRADNEVADFFMKQCRDPEKHEPYSDRPFPRPIWWRKAFLWLFPTFGLWLLRK